MISTPPLPLDWRSWPVEAKTKLLQRIEQRLRERIEFETSEPTEFRFTDLKIRSKDRALLPFTPNEVQRLYLSELCPEWEAGDYRIRGRREIVLKARQFGLSTLIFALLFLDTLSTPNTHTVVIAHDADSTERLFQIVRRFHENLPAELRPATKYANRREYLWPALDSSFFVGTAGTKDFGRSATINNAHLSEAAAYPDAEELVAGLLQAVPAAGNVFVESTAKGLGNWFHDEFREAERGRSRFTARFFGWSLHPEYQSPVPEGFQPTDEERRIQQAHALTDEQLQWRREKETELRRLFPQEYPLTPGEAFLASGGRILDEFRDEDAPAGHTSEDFVPPREWRHLLLIDPGWKTTAGLFAAVDPEGLLWLYGEYYAHQVLPREHVLALTELRQGFGAPHYDVLMDPAGFALKRTTTGHELPSDAEEYLAAAAEQGARWLSLRPADNGDPQAYRVKRYLATGRVRVCRRLHWWRWEQERWVRQAPRRGLLAAERAEPDQPIDRYNHLMDLSRYLCNELERGVGLEADESMHADFWNRPAAVLAIPGAQR